MTRARTGGDPPQEIRFCRAPDGTRLAYARHGSGPPLVISTCWLSHLQYDWESPVWRHFLQFLGTVATVIRYDERGFGLSDWDAGDFSLDSRVTDLQTVVDDAGLDRFALLGLTKSGSVAIAYAHRHPERVTRLLLWGSNAGPAMGPSAEDRELAEAFLSLIRVGWARPDHTFRRVFTSNLIPGASEEQMRWVDALQRVSASPATAEASTRTAYTLDVTPLLGGLAMPTLVLHARGDRVRPFSHGRLLAASIPGARLVALESENHILLEDEPAWPVFQREVSNFMRADADSADADGRSSRPANRGLGELTAQERAVLDLAARGLDNRGIAAELCLSVRTVERHLQNLYRKLGVGGPAARTAAVAAALTSP
jgi:pimeloyl-ACP methyl ester carboxylesterase/DNA-binding CsgD family transcriptional regulator